MSSPNAHDRSGLCSQCRAIICWEGPPLLKNARCPIHVIPLTRARVGETKGARVQRKPIDATTTTTTKAEL